MRRFLTLNFIALLLVSCGQVEQRAETQASSLTEINLSQPEPCQTRTVKWNISKMDFIDTVVSIRQLNTIDTNKLVICNNYRPDLERRTFELTQLEQLVKWADGNIRTSLLGINQNTDSTLIAHYYLMVDSSLQVVEMQRFLLANNGEVIGINVMPNIVEGFIPIAEFNKPDIDLVDCVIIEE